MKTINGLRADGRSALALRPINMIQPCNAHAEGSCQIQMGNTIVHCTATIEKKVPKHITQGGWLTAEYAMLPRATHSRHARDRAPSAPNSRASEIQRLIGRSLRAMVDLSRLGERTITVDCDVLQADGGTRCAAINGGALAVQMAIARLIEQGELLENPLKSLVSAVSLVSMDGAILVDPDYHEDSQCDMDMNVVMNREGAVIEVQASCEGVAPSLSEINLMLAQAQVTIGTIQQLLLARVAPIKI